MHIKKDKKETSDSEGETKKTNKLGSIFRKPSKAVKTDKKEEKKEVPATKEEPTKEEPAKEEEKTEEAKPEPVSKDAPAEEKPAEEPKPAETVEPSSVAPTPAPVQAAAWRCQGGHIVEYERWWDLAYNVG